MPRVVPAGAPRSAAPRPGLDDLAGCRGLGRSRYNGHHLGPRHPRRIAALAAEAARPAIRSDRSGARLAGTIAIGRKTVPLPGSLSRAHASFGLTTIQVPVGLPAACRARGFGSEPAGAPVARVQRGSVVCLTSPAPSDRSAAAKAVPDPGPSCIARAATQRERTRQSPSGFPQHPVKGAGIDEVDAILYPRARTTPPASNPRHGNVLMLTPTIGPLGGDRPATPDPVTATRLDPARAPPHPARPAPPGSAGPPGSAAPTRFGRPDPVRPPCPLVRVPGISCCRSRHGFPRSHGPPEETVDRRP